MDCVVHGVAKPPTGMRDFHFHIYACVYELSHFSSVKLFATPWTIACQAPMSMGFFRQEYRNGLPFPPPGDLPDPGLEPTSLMSPALQADSLPAEPSGKR